MFSVFCKVRFPIPKTKKEKSPGDERKLFLFKCRQKIWGFFFSPFEFPCVITAFVCRRKEGPVVVCSRLPFLKTHPQSHAAHVALTSGRQLPVLRELGERRATSFPREPAPEQLRGAGARGGGAFLLPAASAPSSACLPACLPAGRAPCAAARRALVLLRGPWDKPQSLFGKPGEKNTRKEREHQCHGPALLLSFLKR